MATYNRAHFIAETLRSMQAQIFEDWECLIIDDGGTDNTEEVLSSFLSTDDRFKFFKRKASHKKGLPGCRNYGLDLAKGAYVIFFDDDDIVHPKNLELCITFIQSNDVQFCRYWRTAFYGDFHYQFDAVSDVKYFYIDGKRDVPKMISGALPFNSCAVMWKKECFVNQRFEESLMYAEEWECYARILMQGVKGISLDEILFFGRKHQKSNTGEYQQKNPKRVHSKVKAALLIMNNLNKNGLLDYEMAKYFLALSKRMGEKSIFDHLLTQSTLTNRLKTQLEKRNRYYKLYLLGYKLKKQLVS